MSWRLEKGDCLLPLTGIQSLGEKSVDHVITDPPYEAEAHTLQRRVRNGPGNRNAKVAPLDFVPITEEQRIEVGAQIARVCRRWALVFCQIEAAMQWRRALEAGGMVYKRTCIWDKPDGMPQLTGDRPGMGYETIVVCHAEGKSKWNGGGHRAVFRVNSADADKSGHPTQKPDALMDMLTVLFTDPGETILDPFAGSGSTGVSAIRRGRNFIGWEMMDKYHAMAVKRLSATREQGEIFAKRPKPKQSNLFGGSDGKESVQAEDGQGQAAAGGDVPAGVRRDLRQGAEQGDRPDPGDGQEGGQVDLGAGVGEVRIPDRDREEGDPFDGQPEGDQADPDENAGW